jgi:hypothetical protein
MCVTNDGVSGGVLDVAVEDKGADRDNIRLVREGGGENRAEARI